MADPLKDELKRRAKHVKEFPNNAENCQEMIAAVDVAKDGKTPVILFQRTDKELFTWHMNGDAVDIVEMLVGYLMSLPRPMSNFICNQVSLNHLNETLQQAEADNSTKH